MRWILIAALAALAVVPAALAGPPPSAADRANAVRDCRGLQESMGLTLFRTTYGTVQANRRNAFGRCVSQWGREERENRLNAAQECREERGTTPASQAAFRAKYGKNENDRNAFGKCVSSKRRADAPRGSAGDDERGAGVSRGAWHDAREPGSVQREVRKERERPQRLRQVRVEARERGGRGVRERLATAPHPANRLEQAQPVPLGGGLRATLFLGFRRALRTRTGRRPEHDVRNRLHESVAPRLPEGWRYRNADPRFGTAGATSRSLRSQAGPTARRSNHSELGIGAIPTCRSKATTWVSGCGRFLLFPQT